MMVSLPTHICVTRPKWVKSCQISMSVVQSFCHSAQRVEVLQLSCSVQNCTTIRQLKHKFWSDGISLELSLRFAWDWHPSFVAIALRTFASIRRPTPFPYKFMIKCYRYSLVTNKTVVTLCFQQLNTLISATYNYSVMTVSWQFIAQ